MNRIYRLIWSECLGAFVPAAELTRRRGKRSGRARALAAALVVGAAGLSPDGAMAGNLASAVKPVYAAGTKKPIAVPEKILPKYSNANANATATTTTVPLSPVAATELPTGSQVTAGQATVTSAGDRMTVTEGTPTAAIDWNTFNIGSDAGVTFVQPSSSSVILNRVLSADPSQIFGSLNANGMVFLINAQGVVVGKGAEVNVGGLVASTLNLSDKDLLAGNWAFTGNSPGTVSNAGSIHVTPGGFAALLGSKVENTGSISAKLGSVALASGNQVTLDFDEAGLLKVAISQSALDAMVSNAGAILADGGRIILTAKSADQVLGTVVNNSGVLQAQSIGMRDGQVWLLAADELANTGANGAAANGAQVQGAAGGVASSGMIDVSGQNGAAAGEATLAGTTVTLTGKIDANGAAGNAGRVLINSTQATTLGANSAIDVSSTGSAGKLVAWSDGDTNALGSVDGRGIGASGVGATVEVSSAHGLGFSANVELTAANSANVGTLMLDPATLEIASGSGMAPGTVYQSVLQSQSGNVVLSATGQITVDALTNNVLDLANATSLSITSQSSGGIAFLNNGSGTPSGITTHGAPISLTASGSGALDNIGTLKSNGGDITLSGVYVHLAGGVDATNGLAPAGNVGISVFGGAILSLSASPIAGGEVLLDATYGYIGTAAAPVPTSTADLIVKTGGNAYVANSGSLSTLALTSNHLEGTPVGIDITAANMVLTGADAIGDNTLYSDAVRWTNYSASNPGNLVGPTAVSITEDGNLLPANINLPQTALTLTSNQGYIMGGNTQPVIASTLNLSSSLGIGGTDFYGNNGETDQGVPGATLLTQAGTITANVLDPSANITGIANITQQGDLLGSVQANRVLLQATGNIGNTLAPFAVNTGWYGEVYDVAAGANVNLSAQFLGGVTFDNIQAGGNLNLAVTSQNGWNVNIDQATAAGDVSLTGTQFGYLWVASATSTNGSIAITNDNTLEVDQATLNGTDAVGRSITLTSSYSNVAYGLLSTNGPTGSAAASSPVGSITINAMQGNIYDLAAWEDPPPSVLRAGSAMLNALYGITMDNTGVDTYTNLTLNAGLPGTGSGSIYASLVGIDSVNDPNGNNPHSIHLAGANSFNGNLNVNNYNGDLSIGSVRSYYDCGGGCSESGNVYLYATGSILADGSLGGGRISSQDLNGNGGYVSLNAGGSLGQRGSGTDGANGAVYLSLGGDSFDLSTHGDLFVNNDISQINYLNLNLYYVGSSTPYFYHFTSANAADALANTPGMTFNAGSSGGLLTVNSAAIANNSGNVNLNADGDIEVQSWQAGNGISLGIYGQNITIDAPVNNTPALSMGDTSSLQVQAQQSLTVGNIASTGTNPGDSSVDLEAYGGNLTLGIVSAANANVTVFANNGDILGSAGNQVLANNLTLNNSFGAIGADPTVNGSIPITIGIAQNLTITNEGGGGSINLGTLNDPASLNLTLYTPNSQSYGGANYSMAPATTGLGFSGSANSSGVTLATLGTTGNNPAAVPVSITTDTPSITINSGAGAQLGIGYDLYFGNSYSSMATNLSGSAGQNVIVHLDDNVSQSLNSLTGNIALTNLQIDENLYSWHTPLTVNLTLTQPLRALTLVRTGDDSDPTSFNGSSVSLSGNGQSFTAVETTGTNGSAPGTMTLNGASTSALDLTVNLQTAGIIDVGTINFGALGTVNLTAGLNYQYANPFPGVISAIEGVDGSNSLSAASVNLSAATYYAGQSTVGTSSTAVNVNAPNVALMTSGNLYVTTGGTLSSLAVTASHPYQNTDGTYTATSQNYVYQIGGSTSLTATDDATDNATGLSFTSVTPVNFSFSTDRTIDVGTINAGAAGSVTLNANGNWTGWPYNNYTHIGIEQGSGSGITAGTVTLNANGYQGHAGTNGTALNVDTADLNVNVNSDLNIADSAALDSLSLTLTHQWDNYRDNGYAITAPNIALSLVDQYWNGWGMVALQNLVSSSLQTFSLNTDANVSVGVYGGDFSGGQINLGSTATVNLSTSGSLAQAGWARYILPDTTGSAVPDSAVAIKVGTLNLTVGNNVQFSNDGGDGNGNSISLPVEVANLSVNAGGSAYVTNVGNLNVVSANIVGSGYFRAVEAAPSTPASITGGSLATPLTAGDLTLVTFYGDIGTSAAPVVTNTSTLTLQSGADIYAANQQELQTLSIVSHHNKGSIGDTSNDGLNTLVVTDTNAAGPLQLGVTDLGVNGGGYQLEGSNAPQLNFSFQTDTAISVGALSGNSITLISENDNILHLAGSGTITAGSVSLSAYTPGKSVGAAGESILVDSANLSVSTGGNMYIADASTIDSLNFTIGAVTSLGNVTPVYRLDNSAAANPLHFDVTGDIVNNVLDINSITVSRTDAPVAISVYTPSSGIGVNQISDALVAGGTVSVWSDSSGNVFGLGATPAGISASTVSLIARDGNIGTDTNGAAAPVVVAADTVSALSSGDIRLTSAQTISDLSLEQWNANPAAGAVWAVTTPDFTLQGVVTGTSTLDLGTVTGATTNLTVNSAAALAMGTLNLGSASLNLNAWTNNGGHSIESDGTNGSAANITTTGDVTLRAYNGIGDTTQITTDVGGNVNLSNWYLGIDVAQISGKDLILSGLGECAYCGPSPITITSVGNMTLTNGLGAGSGSGSPVTLTAGGDINYLNTLNLNGGSIALSAGGSISGGDIWNSGSASLTAAGTTMGSAGSISIGSINGAYDHAAPGAITLHALGDVTLAGELVSANSVSITSTAGGIYGTGYGTFSVTPHIILNAYGDIGSGSSGDVGQWAINNGYQNNPGSVTVSAQAGGQINLLSYAAVHATQLSGGGDVSLQVLGDNWHTTNTGVSFGQVSSTNGSVYLGTQQGDIMASGAGSAITAATEITLDAQQNNYFRDSNTAITTPFNLGTSDSPLSLTAPQINLTANGNVYATVPTTGLTDLSVARNYVAYASYNTPPNQQATSMAAGTVLITDVAADTVLDVIDGGWASGNLSAISASYGTALNLSYAGNNAIQLGAITLNGGNLALQATSPSNISITSTGALIQANNFSFNLIDANGRDGTQGTATGGFGTLANPINTEIASLSGTTVGATAGVFMNQIGGITFTNLTTGGDIAVTTTRVTGALNASADIAIGNVSSDGGSVHFTADGAIVAATGVDSPRVAAHGPSNDGGVTLTAAAGVDLPSSNLSSDNGNVSISATTGGVALNSATLNAYNGALNVSATAGGVEMTSSNLNANGNINITATAGGIEMASSQVNSGNGSITVHALDTGLDLAASFVQAGSGAALIALTAGQGDVTFGSINTAGNVAVTATTGAINGTLAAQNLTGQYNGIVAGSNIMLNAATGIGTAAIPVSLNTLNYNGNTITANTTGVGADVSLVTGSQNPGGQATIDGTVGGSITLANYYNTLTLDNVQSQGDIHVTEQNYYSTLLLNNVAATSPGATFTFVAPYGNISSTSTAGSVSASRIVLNALGDPSGGTLGQNISPVNVDADVVIAVASGNIALNSLATGVSKMPLVASNGDTPTVSITAAGDFQVGQVVAGTQGTVNITSAGNILDDGDNTTQIHAGMVNLSAADAIGTALTPISTTAITYDGDGNVTPGVITAASTTSGSIYLTQTGDAILQSLTAANGSINVTINDPAHGQSTLVFADTTPTDAAGNDINVTINRGDLTVDVAQAGMTAGTVNLNATAGSLYGDGRADCCINPNVSGNTVTLTAQNNIGAVSDVSSFAGTALGVEANQSTATTTADLSQIYIQYVGNATVGTGLSVPNRLNLLGSNPQVLLAACGDLTLAGLNLPSASLGLLAGTGGNGGSVLDGINGGASLAMPDVTAASISFGAMNNVGDVADSLWVNTPMLSAQAFNGGVWVNNAATTPVSVPLIVAGNGPVVLGGQGDLLLGVVATSGSATVSSANGAVLDGATGGANADNPNIIATSVTVTSATNGGSAGDALWVNSPSITASASSGGVWINDAATTPVTVNSVTTNGGPIVIGSQGDLAVVAVNAGSGSATLNSATGAVADGIQGGSNAANPNVIAGTVTVNSAVDTGNASDALWVNAANIGATANGGGVWINDAATTPVTVTSIASNGPVVIGAQGNLLVDTINAGGGTATLTSATGGVLDGVTGGSNANNPNVTASAVTVNSAVNAGNASDALWVNAAVITGSATTGGVWINDASTAPVTVSSVTTNGGPVVIGSQGELAVAAVNAGSGSATLNSATGAVIDGITGGSNAANPNVIAGSVSVNSAIDAGNPADALWVNAAVISGSATTGGVWINDASTGPVTVTSITGNGPVVINAQANLWVDSINAGSGSATLTSATGGVLDGVSGGSNAGHPNVTASAVTVNSAVNAGNASDALWVNAAVISGSATTGGVWINDASTSPVTVASVTTNGGPVVIGSHGELAVVAVNAGSGSATLNSATGAVVDGITGGSNAANPNVIAGSVSVNSAIDAGNPSDALWVNAAIISGSANTGGVWINDASTAPVTVSSVTTHGGAVVIGGQGELAVVAVNAGSGSATLNSATGAVVDGITGGSNAANPNVIAGTVNVNSAIDAGNSSDALWVSAANIGANANGGGVWINDAATTPVTVTSVTAGNGPVVIGSQGNMLVNSVNAGSSSATLSSAAGSVLDGIHGGSSASRPNVTAGSVTVNSAANGGNANDALWVDAATISGTATNGGVWINDAATTPVTVTSITAGNGAVVIGSQGDLLIDSVNAGKNSATLVSVNGSVLDGIEGGSSAANPNVTAGSVTVDSGANGGNAGDALWVNAAVINAAVTAGGVWINDAASTPVKVSASTANNGAVVIGTAGDLLVGRVATGTGDVTLDSGFGSILDGMRGGSSTRNPNIIGGTVTLTAQGGVGTTTDRVYINGASIDVSGVTSDQFINAPPTPYPGLPLVPGVSPVTVYAAYAQAQVQPPQQLPVTLIGQPLRMAPPIEVTADLFGLALPSGVDADAAQQDSSMDTASKPIFGGNDEEVGRKKALLKLKKKSPRESKRELNKQTQWKG